MPERNTARLPDGAKVAVHEFGRLIGRWLYRPAFRIRIHGRERIPLTGPVVLVANHSSLVEPQVIFGLLPRQSVFLVKAELASGALAAPLRWLGQLTVNRGRPERGPLLAAASYLRDGGLIGVFPEGTRGSGDVDQAEQGAAWLVRASGAVVLPVATRGTLRPPGTRRRFRPKLDVLIGAPFPLSVQRGRQGLAAATEEIRGQLADLVRELDELRSAKTK